MHFIWHLLKNWLSFFFPTFYKKIQAHNLHRLNTPDPVIIAMNHPNAFTDPIGLTYLAYPTRLYYMARGDAFKPGVISWLLEIIGIVPIFRIQDAGKEGLMRNEATYRRVNRLLERNAKVMVFAEGLCVQERRLRPLKKGVARMVFGAYEHLQHDRLKVLPVGVTYSRPHKFRSKLFYNLGEPIPVKDYIAQYRENPARAMLVFLQRLEEEMMKTVLHIPDPRLDDAVHYAEKLVRADLLLARGIKKPGLYDEFVESRHIIAKVSAVSTANPDLYESFATKAKDYFTRLRELRIKDWLLQPRQQGRNTGFHLLLRLLAILLLSPVYLAGMLANFPPYALSNFITSRIVKAVEFFSSFFFGIVMVVFLLVYSLWFWLLYTWLDNLAAAAGALVLLGLCGMACLHIHPFLLRSAGLVRFLANRREMALLKEKRAELVSIINKF